MQTFPEDIIDFWYTERIKKQWFNSSSELDTEIKQRFESTWSDAASGIHDPWKKSAEGCLALCIVLDQFPLNMYRGETRSFTTETQAVNICKYAVERELDKQLAPEKRVFLYMPLMHSENLNDQSFAVKLFTDSGLSDNARFARHHRSIIERFGRFPHRNSVLGRDSSKEELGYLASKEAFTG